MYSCFVVLFMYHLSSFAIYYGINGHYLPTIYRLLSFYMFVFFCSSSSIIILCLEGYILFSLACEYICVCSVVVIMAATMLRGEQANMVVSIFVTVLIASLFVNSVIALHATSSETQKVASKLHLSARKLQFQGGHDLSRDQNTKRMLIGSTAPTCTYNECKGCKYRCRAEQIPVDGNDPLNNAYRYKCICHR